MITSTAKPGELFEFEAIAGVILISVLVLSASYSKPLEKKLVRATLTGVRWIAAVFAGTMFAIGYTIFAESWPIGVLAIVLYFALVVLAIRIIEISVVSITSKFLTSSK